MSQVPSAQPMASFAGTLATGLVETVDLVENPDALERGGWWAVAATFEGALTAHRFSCVRPAPLPSPRPSGTGGDQQAWSGVTGPWSSSLGHDEYCRAVESIRGRIEAGDVYQVNLCRRLSAPLSPLADPIALAARLAAGNPAAHQGIVHDGTNWIVTASPELFLSRSGDHLVSSPVKGTARLGEPFAAKDFPENIMITDLVRNDLGRVAVAGSVRVGLLTARLELPGLAHLVSSVHARLRPGVGWSELLAATFPPGSVSGAPKSSALQVIAELEPVARGPYCGAVGYIDSDHHEAVLAVGIRTFYTAADRDGAATLNFGTGAGITYASDPHEEWRETELKAERLIQLAGALPAGVTASP